MMKYIVNGIFKAVVQITIFIVSFILDLIFTLFGEITFPNFSTYAQYLQGFWDLVFQFVGYIRSIFLIDSFSMWARKIKFIISPKLYLIRYIFI